MNLCTQSLKYKMHFAQNQTIGCALNFLAKVKHILNIFEATIDMNTLESTHIIKFDFCTVTLREDGILENRFLWDVPYEVDSIHLKESSEAMTLLSKGSPMPVLSVAGLYGSMTTDARNVDINNAESYTLALALVIHSLSQRLLSNFYFKIKKVSYPVKTFKTAEDAEQWLLQQVRVQRKAV